MKLTDLDVNDKELIEFIGEQQSQEVHWAGHFLDKMENLKQTKYEGSPLPWDSTLDKVLLRTGEVSVWAGMNGHKKSMMLSQVLLWLAKDNPIGIMSFELPVEKTLERMSRQAIGCDPSRGALEEFLEWGNGRICLYDNVSVCPADRVLGVLFLMATRYGCKHIAIDSLMMCGLTKGDYQEEKLFVEMLVSAAKSLNVHIHVVAHVRKPDKGGDDYRPNRYDVRGAGEISDKVDNLFIVWENKRKRKLLQKNPNFITDKEQAYIDTAPDQLLNVDKQRFGDWEGSINLYFHGDSLQFHTKESTRAMYFPIN